MNINENSFRGTIEKINISRPVIFCVLLLVVLTISGSAVNPDKRITQYAHTAWRVRDGIFNGAPNAITQTTDGYIWIGTLGGLVRFDGLRFVPWSPPDGQSLFASKSIFSLLPAKDGSLWIGTGTNLAHLKDGVVTNYTDALGRINSIVEDRDGSIWYTRSRVNDTKGPLCRVIDANVRCLGSAEGISVPYAEPLATDSDGNIFPDEIYAAPKSWVERAYPKLIHFNRLPKGGHFAAW